MSKKGQVVWEVTLIFELIAGILVSLVLLNILYTGTYASKDVMQYDYALMKKTLAAVPGDVSIKYDIGRLGFKDGRFVETKTKMLGKRHYLLIKKTGDEITEAVHNE